MPEGGAGNETKIRYITINGWVVQRLLYAAILFLLMNATQGWLYLGGGGYRVVSSLQARKEFQKIVQGRLERWQVLQHVDNGTLSFDDPFAILVLQSPATW